MPLGAVVKSWTNVDENSPLLRDFVEAWLQHVDATPETTRYARTDEVSLERYGTRLRPDSHRKWYARTRRVTTRFEGRWCGCEDDQLKPILSVDEIPRFFWNLAKGKLSTHPPSSVEDFQQQGQRLCWGLVRADIRKLKSLLPHQDSLKVSTNGKETDVRRPLRFPLIPTRIQQADTILHDPTPQQNLSEAQLENQIRSHYQPVLKNFRRDLIQRQEQGGETYFDACIPGMLKMLGKEGKLPWADCQSADGSSRCDYIVMPTNDLQGAVRSGLPPIPIVVRNDKRDLAKDLNDRFLEMLKGYHHNSSTPIQVRDFSAPVGDNAQDGISGDCDDGSSGDHDSDVDEHDRDHNRSPGFIAFEDLHARYQKSNDQSDFGASLPINCLDFYNLGMPRSEILAGHPRYHGIQVAARRLQGRGSGKSSYTNSSILACTAFELFSLRGSWSGPHCDIYGGTYITCLSGVKAWFVYSFHDPLEVSQQIEEFKRDGNWWSPRYGILKLIVLRPGDTLLMPAGATIIHAVMTLQSSVMSGGMFIDIQRLYSHVKHVSSLVSSDKMTNEYISSDFPVIWQELMSVHWQSLNEEQRAELSDADHRLRKCLSCSCLKKRKRTPKHCSAKSCPCLQRNLLQHCSIWCHPAPRKCG